MFTLQKKTAKLSSVNPRVELHGEEHVMAADLKFSIKVSNDILSEFHPSLKSALYKKSEGGQADFIDDPGHMPERRFPLMAPVKWDKNFIGYKLTVHYGISGTQDNVLIDCTIDGFRFECQDGGTVIASFRVIAHPTSAELGRLCEMIQQDVSISLFEQSSEDPQQDLDEAA